MADSKVQQEPSIEEILSSIRQIINEDGDDASANSAGAPPQPSAMAGNDDDVLDLANLAKPNLDVPAPSMPVVDEAVAAPDIEFDEPKADEPMKVDDIDAMFDAPAAPAPEPTPAPAAPPHPAPVMVEEVTESLISEGALSAAAASLTKLAQAEVMIDHKHAAGIGSVTLEDVVKEMLRPMMKSWLDENLPPLVERLVQKEILKISSRL